LSDDRSYTAAEVDAALAALVEPGRLAHAQDVVVHAAPALQRVLADALAEGGWFGDAHNAEVNRVASESDEGERATAVSTLVADQTRLGMFVGVAVGFQLAHELAANRKSEAGISDAGMSSPSADLSGVEVSGVGASVTNESGADAPGAQHSREKPNPKEH
jgi:hypothetical protein